MSRAAITNVGGRLGEHNTFPDPNLELSPAEFCSPLDISVRHETFKTKTRTPGSAKRPSATLAEPSSLGANNADLALVRDAVRRERRRISRDLHDHAGQFLVGIALRLAALEQTNVDPARNGVFAELRLLLSRFSQELRAISHGERHGVPFGCDLTLVLGSLADQWGRETGISVRFHSELSGVRYVPDDLTMEALFRIAQEALTNVAKHATHASHVSVRLMSTPESIILAIEDDGPGFVFSQADGDKSSFRRGGIINMQERLAERGGRLVICNSPTGGTSVVATVPTDRHRHRQGAGPNEKSDTHLSR